MKLLLNSGFNGKIFTASRQYVEEADCPGICWNTAGCSAFSYYDDNDGMYGCMYFVGSVEPVESAEDCRIPDCKNVIYSGHLNDQCPSPFTSQFEVKQVSYKLIRATKANAWPG